MSSDVPVVTKLVEDFVSPVQDDNFVHGVVKGGSGVLSTLGRDGLGCGLGRVFLC